MEITQENFDARLPEVLNAISTCDFLAFDCEFSGMGLGGMAIMSYDTPMLVYDKTKRNISNFTVMQFGLATFSYDPQTKGFRYRVFNFYVFPRLPKSLSRLRACITDQFTFSAQADCMDFLASQNFDFNKWIIQGIGYIREVELTKLSEELKRRYAWRMKSGRTGASNETPSVPVKSNFKMPEHAAAKLKDVMKKIEEFVKNETETELILGDINLQERRLLFQIIEKDYPTSIFAHAIQREDGSADVFIRKCADAEDYDRMQQQKLDAELKELEDAAGFCKVIKAISESRKPILGHNLFLDLLHVTRAFCCPLPDTYDRFKKLVQKRFSKIIDTKVLAGQNQLKAVAGTGMSLSDLQKKVLKHPFVPVPVEPEHPDYSYALSKENLHEAGYDAFLTGFIFIHLANYLGEHSSSGRGGRPGCVKQTRDIPWDLLRSLYGKITPGRIVDLPYLSLATPDLVPDRRHVFYMRFLNGQKTWTNHDIIPLFSPYGQIFINWIDQDSAFVSLKNREQSDLVKKAMVDSNPCGGYCDGGYSIRSATSYLDEMEQLILDCVFPPTPLYETGGDVEMVENGSGGT